MSKLTIEQKMEIGDRIAKTMGMKPNALTGRYPVGIGESNMFVTELGVYEAFKKAADELREEGKI